MMHEWRDYGEEVACRYCAVHPGSSAAFLPCDSAPLSQAVSTMPTMDVDANIEEEQHERFEVTDDATASWAMKKLRNIRRQMKTNSELAEEEHRQIDEWHEEVTRPLAQSAQYFEGLLTAYALRCRHNDEDGRKTISLPAGKVSTRRPSPKWQVDAEAFLEWARTVRPDLVRTKEEPNLAEMKNALFTADVDEQASQYGTASLTVIDPDTGERVPGVRVDVTNLTATITTN